MSKPVAKIYASRQPRRPHHVADWMERRNLTQADLSRELGADKSTVSRWLTGSTPGEQWQEKLATLFQCEREALFRHPDDDWISKMFRDRSADEVDRMKKMLEAAFPPHLKKNEARKTGTGD